MMHTSRLQELSNQELSNQELSNQELSNQTLLDSTNDSAVCSRSWVGRIWQMLGRIFPNPYEPTVRHRVDRQGRIKSWHVYDPASGHSMSFGSEMEVRLWLEHRYYL